MSIWLLGELALKAFVVLSCLRLAFVDPSFRSSSAFEEMVKGLCSGTVLSSAIQALISKS
ncbi:MAG: hypothetical protein RMY62_001945 [Nostoc sp. ZfuVER08]